MKSPNNNPSTATSTPWPNATTNTAVPHTLTLEEFMAEMERPIPLWKKARYSLRRAIHKPRELLNEVRWGWQRARRGYSEADTWSFDHYLSGVIAGGLGRIQERAIGYPSGLTPEKWDAALGQMIASFSLAHHNAFENDYAEMERKFQKGARLFVKHYFSLWD